ncbi:N-acetylmuramic acid 6-phosphate etherase [Faunimonas sp. B44]|uniref:N-acetylmuramic acid 6-phosphate etherase n=1 Tax=Faunimonas sp. B44 TaxID=3461493 RepID=UPI0040450940
MDTERLSPRYRGIDAWDLDDMLDALVEAQFVAVAAVRAARADVAAAAAAVEARLEAGGRLVYAGAGTSGRLAAQDGAELTPTFGWPRDRLLLLIAGGERALTQAIEGAEDERDEAERLVREAGIGAADVMIALAASGTTPFTLACIAAAKERGALAIGIANNPGTPLLSLADHAVLLDTGAEPIAGSTRLKAGTAQKIALNVLSSAVMIRLGRVHEGLMVDVQAGNAKLVRRSEEMLLFLTDRSREAVREALVRAGGRVKVAALLLRGCELRQAEDLLARTGGRLRAALTMLETGSGMKQD